MTGIPPQPWLLLQAAALVAGGAALTAAALVAALALLRPDAPAGAREARILRWTRPGFLLLGVALVAGVQAAWQRGDPWPFGPRDRWCLIAWLICFAALHVHRVKAFQGRPAILAGLAAWGLTLAAWLVLT